EDTADTAALQKAVDRAAEYLAGARPTAVNLFNALDRMKRTAVRLGNRPPAPFKEALAREAQRIRDEDAEMCRAIGRHGLTLLRDDCTVLTHCNAGGLATSEYGTALAPVYLAREQGWTIRVFADETRPLLQGARLTAWELMQAGIDVTLICDNMAASVMATGKISAVLVGADRIAANGDTANKIGTYSLAVLAAAHEIPFYVLAPTITFDLAIPNGGHIPIEHRPAEEVTEGLGRRTAPHGVKVHSPAFDVTPAGLITAIVCERGIARPPYETSLAQLLQGKKPTP
ncbi:MAG: S-methyl-5-thioribose-1-phosphate isomerase, partial [Verrucomicrobia bacterium]|nr:S-methyl-5-thioribose-1-phosphate isomerase [Verrucomicrobiota bacterium]